MPLQIGSTDALPNPQGVDNTSRVIVRGDEYNKTSTDSSAVYGAQRSGGLIANAETRDGGYVTRELRGDDVVRIEGVPVAVEMAERLGYLRRDGDRYVEVAANDPSHPSARRAAMARDNAFAVRAAEEADGISVDSGVSATIEDWSASARQFGVNPVKLLGDVMTSDGTTVPQTLTDMARAYGVSETGLAPTMRQIKAEVSRGLGEHLQTRVGLPPQHLDGVLEFMRTRLGPAGVVSAFAELVFKGSAEVFRDYAGQFKRARGL